MFLSTTLTGIRLKWKLWLKIVQLSWSGLDALSLVGPIVVLLLDFCCSSVSVLVLLLSTHLLSSQCWILMYMFAVLMHRWVRKLHRGRISWMFFKPQHNLRRGLWLSSWRSVRSVFILCRLYCMRPFPVWCLGENTELDSISPWLLPFHYEDYILLSRICFSYFSPWVQRWCQ